MTSSSTPAPANTTGPGGTALVYGNGAGAQPGHTLRVYADLRCPFCKRLERGLGPVMEKLAEEGRVTLEYQFATLIDDGAGGTGSLRALSAVGAASDVGVTTALRYIRSLFASQPAEGDDAFADADVLLRLAEEVEGLRGPDFDRKVTEGFYIPWARRVSAAFEASGVTGTPTVLFDGRPVTVINPMGYAVTPEAFLAELALD
ncbi:DsbA family protein [Streptomyces sp. cmx-18-6]|uniref:DsbA family protein n=1 Tax=Streptomyces sp. cmx-18-6 TaxID=2790930 RepID=UPI0039813A10